MGQRNSKFVSPSWIVSDENSSVAMLDYLPIIGQAIQLVAEILFSGFSDYFGVRLPFLLLHSVSLS